MKITLITGLILSQPENSGDLVSLLGLRAMLYQKLEKNKKFFEFKNSKGTFDNINSKSTI